MQTRAALLLQGSSFVAFVRETDELIAGAVDARMLGAEEHLHPFHPSIPIVHRTDSLQVH